MVVLRNLAGPGRLDLSGEAKVEAEGLTALLGAQASQEVADLGCRRDSEDVAEGELADELATGTSRLAAEVVEFLAGLAGTGNLPADRGRLGDIAREGGNVEDQVSTDEVDADC